MKLKASELASVLQEWLENAVLPKSNEFAAAALWFIWLQNKPRIADHLSKIQGLLGADADGYLDLDSSYNNAKLALEKKGGKILIPLLNWNLDKDDLDLLFKLAREIAR